MPRWDHTATLLADGRVLIAGGGNSVVAEIYDPSSGTFTAAGSLWTNRSWFTATPLLDGRVLIEGSASSAELYDPSSGTFTQIASTVAYRSASTATRLPDGPVLVAGGRDPNNNALSSADLYEP